MKKPITALLLTLTVGTIAFAQGAEKRSVYLEPSSDLMEKTFNELELEYEELEDETYKLNMSGMTVVLFLGETDLQLYCGIKQETSHYRINSFNRDYKWCRAYIDTDGDPVLESDISFIGGLGYDGMISFFANFEELLTTFVKHIE